MSSDFSLSIQGWSDGQAIPPRFAFGKPGKNAPFAASDNISPALRWQYAPAKTRSFALLCYDTDVPSSGEDVNQEGKVVPKDLARVRFYHWVAIDIAADRAGLEEGSGGRGVVAQGKAVGKTEYGITGKNDYTSWFAADAEMAGTYGGYDGPCPPWNDSIVHRYCFEIFALDVDSLNLQGDFSGDDVVDAMQGHILAQAKYTGTYSMNPSVPA